MNDYKNSITVNAKPDEVAELIGRVPAWWGADFQGHSHKVDDSFTVRFGDTWVNFRLTEVVPGRKIVWKVMDCNLAWLRDKNEWKDTEIVWELASQGNATRVNFTHVGLVPEIECYKNCSLGWNFYLQKSLVGLVNENLGLPDQDPD